MIGSGQFLLGFLKQAFQALYPLVSSIKLAFSDSNFLL